MKVFKYFIILSILIALSYFSWDYYAGRLNKGKYEKATLVFEDYGNSLRIFDMERL